MSRNASYHTARRAPEENLCPRCATPHRLTAKFRNCAEPGCTSVGCGDCLTEILCDCSSVAGDYCEYHLGPKDCPKCAAQVAMSPTEAFFMLPGVLQTAAVFLGLEKLSYPLRLGGA